MSEIARTIADQLTQSSRGKYFPPFFLDYHNEKAYN